MRRPDRSRLAESLWYGVSPLADLLQPLAWLFAVGVALRRWLYRRGLLRATRLPVPVVVVGNLTVGGAGKTPIVDWLVGILGAAGFRPGIVSRGYGRHRAGVMMVRTDAAAAVVGDEPLLLSRRTGVPVCVGRDRAEAAGQLLAAGVDVIVADDGLQHYRLERDLEIAVVDGVRRFGNRRMLPAGPLREPLGRLAEVDLVLVNGGSAEPGEHRFRLVPGEARLLRGEGRRPLRDFAGQSVRMVAGIGNPDRFRRELEAHGLRVEPVPVADHGRCDLVSLLQERDSPILMTEKDAVKYPDAPAGPVWVVPVQVEMDSSEVASMIVRRLADPGARPDPLIRRERNKAR